MKWKFEPKDFAPHGAITPQRADSFNCSLDYMCDRANAKLDGWRKEATVVLGASGDGEPITWYNENIKDSTHRALLIDIEPIEKKPCEHEPMWSNKIPGWNHAPESDAECRHCGAKLKARWEAAE